MSSFPPPPDDGSGPRRRPPESTPPHVSPSHPDGAYPVYEPPQERRGEGPPPAAGTAPAPGAWPPGAPTARLGPTPGGVGERILARVLDAMIISVASMVVGGVVGVIGAFVITGSEAGEIAVLTVLFVIGVAIVLGYYAALESGTGATLGKRALKLRVVGPDGHSTPTVVQSVKRNVFLVFYPMGVMPTDAQPLTPTLSLIIAVSIIVTISQDQTFRRGWHDRFAGTAVIKD